MSSTLKQHLFLLWHLTLREAFGRYRGSLFGVGWVVITPIIMLLIYTFVFSVVFQVRWGGTESSRIEFALNLYAGLLLHGLLADTLTRSPALFRNHVNFVKKVVFPLWILPLVNLCSSLIHALIGFAILLLANFVVNDSVQPTLVMLPLVLLPFLTLLAGVGWLLSAVGIYLRDISQVMPLVSVAALFLAPVFYPISMLPEPYQGLLYLNPLTTIVEQTRQVLLQGAMADAQVLIIFGCAALAFGVFGWWVFRRLQRGFADAL